MAKVEVESRGQVSLLTLNRPDRHNAIDAEAASLIEEAIRDFADDPEASALVVTGAGGKAFSSGADLLDGQALFEGALQRDSEPLQFSGLDPGKPTIAAIEGYCLAGGLELACWCDFRVAGKSARFGVVNRRWGVPLVDGGTQRLPRIVGLSNALYLIESGVLIDADRARDMGLVQEVVDDGQALDRAMELAVRIVEYPQLSLGSDRGSTLAALGSALEDGLAHEVASGIRALSEPELEEGLRRFASGDRPDPPVPKG